jgi:transcriptional regulator with XRE-family HTH domain
MQNFTTICTQINQHLTKNNISYETIALKTGFKISTIKKILNANYSPKLQDVLTIANAANLTLFFK